MCIHASVALMDYRNKASPFGIVIYGPLCVMIGSELKHAQNSVYQAFLLAPSKLAPLEMRLADFVVRGSVCMLAVMSMA